MGRKGHISDTVEGAIGKAQRGKHISRGLSKYQLRRGSLRENGGVVSQLHKEKEKREGEVSDCSGSSFLDRWFAHQK